MTRNLKAMCASLPPLTDLPGFDVIPWWVDEHPNHPEFKAMYVKHDAGVDPDPEKTGVRIFLGLSPLDVERNAGHLAALVQLKCESAIMSLRDLYAVHGKPFPGDAL